MDLESNPAIECLLNCSVCLEPFQRPKLLRCGHTFCLDCLEQLSDQSPAITCPLCKQKTLKPATGLASLTDDFKVSQIRDGLLAATQLAAPQEKCDVCKGSVAIVNCLQCHKAMCNTCRDKHNRRAEATRHTLLRQQDVVECGIHDDICSHICKDCRALICMSCVLDRCGDHVCVEIGDAARSALTGGRLHDNHVKKVLSGFQDGAQKQEQLFAAIQREIQSHTDRVTVAVKSEGKRLKDELTVLQKASLEKLELSRLAAEERLIKLSSLPDASAASLQNGIPSDLLKALPSLMANTEQQGLEDFKMPEVKFEAALNPADLKLGALIVHQQEFTEKADIKVFRFDKVVQDLRGGNTALVGLHGELIARNDYTADGTDNVTIYRRGESAGYNEQLKLVESYANIFTRNVSDLICHLKPMTIQLKGYAKDHGIRLTYKDLSQVRLQAKDRTGKPGRSSSTDPKQREQNPGPGPKPKGNKPKPRGKKQPAN